MTTALRRWLLLPVIAAALVLVSTAPANADFATNAALAPTSVSTLQVAPPTNLSTAGTNCTTYVDPVTATSTTTLHAHLAWTASRTARGVTGYAITAVFADGSSYPVGSVDAATTSTTGDADGSYATMNVRLMVTTTTSYGWTAQSALSSALSC